MDNKFCSSVVRVTLKLLLEFFSSCVSCLSPDCFHFCSREKTQFTKQTSLNYALPNIGKEPEQWSRAWAEHWDWGWCFRWRHPQSSLHYWFQFFLLFNVFCLFQSQTPQTSQREDAKHSAKTTFSTFPDDPARQDVSLHVFKVACRLACGCWEQRPNASDFSFRISTLPVHEIKVEA